MQLMKIFSRKFSQIGNIQKEHVIEYFIVEKIENNKKIYGILVSEFNNKKFPERNSVFVSYDYSKVYNILKFLYENSIGELEFKDIINELHVF